jgi:hypothetical protein
MRSEEIFFALVIMFFSLTASESSCQGGAKYPLSIYLSSVYSLALAAKPGSDREVPAEI